MGYSTFVGRVGALAVALGVGVSVGSPGIAWADETETTDDPRVEASQEENETAEDEPVEVDEPESDEDGEESGGEVEEPEAAEELDDSEELDDTEEVEEVEEVEEPEPETETLDENNDGGVDFVDEVGSSIPTVARSAEPDVPPAVTEQPTTPEPPRALTSAPEPTVLVSVLTFDDEVPVEFTQRVAVADESSSVLAQQIAPAAAEPNPLARVLAVPAALLNAAINLAVAVLEPYIGPGGPFDNALLWGVLAWVRRESNLLLDNHTPEIGVDTMSLDVVSGDWVAIGLPDVDADGEVLTYSVAPRGEAGGPQAGTVTIVGNVVTYVPDAGYVGADAFVVTASDAAAGNHLHQLGGHTDTVAVNVVVSPANEPLSIGSATGPGVPAIDGTVTGSVVVTDEDLAGVTVGVVTAGKPEHGTVTLEFDDTTGVVTYTYRPTLATRLRGGTGETFGPDSFVIAVSDGVNPAVEQSVTGVEVGGAATLAVGDSAALAGDNNEHFVISNDGKRAYVLNYDDNQTISVVDLDPTSTTYTDVVQTIPLGVAGEDPISFADRIEKTPDGTRAYITVTHVDGGGVESSDIHVLDLSTHTIVDTVDTGLYGDEMYFSPDGSLMYFVDYGVSGDPEHGQLRVLNTDPTSSAYHSFVSTPVSIPGIDQLVVSEDGTRLFALSVTPAGDSAYLVEYVANPYSEYWGASVSDPIGTTPDAYSLALSPDTKWAYFTNRDGDYVTFVNTYPPSAAYGYSEPVAAGDAPDLLRVSADGSVVYILNTYYDNSETTLTVLDTETGAAIVDELPLGSSAWALRLNPDGSGWFTTDEYTGGAQAPGLTELRLVPLP